MNIHNCWGSYLSKLTATYRPFMKEMWFFPWVGQSITTSKWTPSWNQDPEPLHTHQALQLVCLYTPCGLAAGVHFITLVKFCILTCEMYELNLNTNTTNFLALKNPYPPWASTRKAQIHKKSFFVSHFTSLFSLSLEARGLKFCIQILR